MNAFKSAKGLLLHCTICTLAIVPVDTFADGPTLSFNRDVRSILSDKCYCCHGSDASHREAERRLDMREGALANSSGVVAVVPGKPNESELVLRVFSTDGDQIMPPPSSNKLLTDIEKDTLRRWIAEGAEYEPHWAFVAPHRTNLPAGVNAVDYFIEEKLRANSLSFSPQADRGLILRRLWLGLTMQCSQCHDHKFDPIKQSDYYSMFAMFNQLSEPGGVDKRFGRKEYSDTYDKLYSVESPFFELATPELTATLKAVRSVKQAAEAALEAKRPDFEPQFIAWIMEMRANTDLITERVAEDGLRRNVGTAPLDKPKDGKTRGLLEVYLKKQPQWKPLLEAIAVAQDAEDTAMIAIPLVMVMRDDKRRDTFMLMRGSFETPGDEVLPNVPEFLPTLSEGVKADRLALAKWLVSPDQPLMSRVVMNRLWQMVFGLGLVKTPDDFGAQGALPSHPELLDWLAVEFRESGWDLKHMLELIVTSRAYRQSACISPMLQTKDPENALLARGPRFRLDSRFLRDQALSLAGLLVEKQGGFPVMPYQPPGIWGDISFGKNRYFQGTGDDLYRRSLYTFWRRSVAPANFFDVPSRQSCAVKPLRTNTPFQALTTLNDTTYVEAARVWAEKRIANEQDDVSRFKNAFYAATARMPEARELASLQASLAKSRDHFRQLPNDALKLISIGESPRDQKLGATEHAALTTLCLLILNLDETVTR